MRLVGRALFFPVLVVVYTVVKLFWGPESAADAVDNLIDWYEEKFE